MSQEPENIMATRQIDLTSPTGQSVALRLQRDKKKGPASCFHEVHMDLGPCVARNTIPDILHRSLKAMPAAPHYFVGIHWGPRLSLDASLAPAGSNIDTVFYRAQGEIQRSTLEALYLMPYGEFFILGCTGADEAAARLPSLTDLDSCIAALGDHLAWAIGYCNEIAHHVVLSREREIAYRQILDALDDELG